MIIGHGSCLMLKYITIAKIQDHTGGNISLYARGVTPMVWKSLEDISRYEFIIYRTLFRSKFNATISSVQLPFQLFLDS